MVFQTKRVAARFAAAAMIVAVGLLGQSAMAQDEAAGPEANLKDIVGDWVIVLDGLPGVPQKGSLVVTEDGDGVSAKITTPLNPEEPLEVDEVSVSGSDHVMIFFVDAMGQSMDVQSTAVVDKAGQTLEGTLLIGGGMLEAVLKGAIKGSSAEKDLNSWLAARTKEIVGEPVLPVADAKEFMGGWTFSGDSPMGGPMEIAFELVDEGGKASGRLEMPQPLGTQILNRLEISDAGSLVMTYSMNLMGQEMDMTIDLEREGPLLVGLIDVGGGLFQIPLEGTRAGRGKSMANIAGKSFLVEYGRPSTDGNGYKSMDKMLKKGFVWRLGNNDVTYFKSDADIMFGKTKVPAGEYGVAARFEGDDTWTLLFNSQSTGNGMTLKDANIVAEVPLKSGKPDVQNELLVVELAGTEGNNGTISISWGKIEAAAEFEVDVPAAPATN
jgi:hypothetical protein